jgi:ribonuclease-3
MTQKLRPFGGALSIIKEIFMKSLEEKLGYTFQDPQLLENALTHSSRANESRGKLQSNERLEFLGDSILGMVVAEHLYRNHPSLPEGELTRIRAALVCEESLVVVAEDLGLGEYLRLGKGEEAGGGRQRPSIRADAVEAVLAAVYLDGGIGSARKIIQKYILSREIAGITKPRDYKTSLQELVQRESGQVLQYRLTGEEGPDHNKRFYMSVELNGSVVGSGSGKSKKEAEQMAAKAAIAKLRR